MRRRDKITVPKVERMNLIPIMDAIFLFIFFLLTSSQMIKFFEIDTDAPVVTETSSSKEDKGLMLGVDLTNETLILRKGLEKEIIETFEISDLSSVRESIRQRLVAIKNEYQTEKEVIISPVKATKMQLIVNVMDLFRKKFEIEGIKKDLFPQVVLEPKN